MTAPLETSVTEPAPEAVLEGVRGRAIQGRSLTQIAWMRLRRDKVALAGGVIVVLLVLVAIFAPLIVKVFGHPPNEFHQELIDPNLQVPKDGWGMSREFLFGLEPVNGRDIFSRVVYGARISLLIAILATLVSVGLGTVLGVTAGYFGGWLDSMISRTMDVFLAFPVLLFAMALVGAIPERAFGLSGEPLRVALLIVVISFFTWPYVGRIIRGQTLSLRHREFVEASRSLGARGSYIVFREMLPNLAAPILIYTTLLIPTNILFEAALSFLGVGVRPPTPSWGQMIADGARWYTIAPQFMLFPGLAIFITVLAFNLFGDGLRDALDPRGR
jgi:peptide/nickel transport system permease protein